MKALLAGRLPQKAASAGQHEPAPSVFGSRRAEALLHGWQQEEMEVFILERIRDGAALPGTYPPNDATRAAYEEWRRRQQGDQ